MIHVHEEQSIANISTRCWVLFKLEASEAEHKSGAGASEAAGRELLKPQVEQIQLILNNVYQRSSS